MARCETFFSVPLIARSLSQLQTGTMLIGDDDDDFDLEVEHDHAMREGSIAEAAAAAVVAANAADQRAVAAAQEAAEAAVRDEPVELTPEACSMLPMMKQLLVAYQGGGVSAAAAQMRLIDIRFASMKAALRAAEPRDDEEEEVGEEAEEGSTR